MVKEFLSSKGIPFQEYDVSRDSAAAQEMINRTGQQGVPVTIIDGQIVIGFDRPQLDRLLGQNIKPVFGASIADADRITGGKAAGAYIGQVRPNSVAASMGLTTGDIIIAVNMQVASNADDFVSLISRFKPGNRFSITYVRNNRPVTIEGSF
ncbi:MAG: PDZ domain-containing protein [Dehalococcoidales bacterium]|nr:PDZ domain-containing protein [Dehalococcoidales bacterium]